jgi:predicted metal-dependent HD superfamily phosphohydrolase
MTDLRPRFQALFDRPADNVFAALAARYAEPVRRYHTIEHIADCLAELDRAGAVGDPAATEMALWWHDAVYDPAAPDNERRSAELADRDLAGLGIAPEVRHEVGRLILLTAGHAVDPNDAAGARLVAIDLSILGRPPAVYDAYAAAIRQEYAHVPDAFFRPGRARILQGFLEGPIYADPAFAARYEVQARANLTREIAALTA